MNHEEKIKEFLDIYARAQASLDQIQSAIDEQRKIIDGQQDSLDRSRAHWQYLKAQALRDSGSSQE